MGNDPHPFSNRMHRERKCKSWSDDSKGVMRSEEKLTRQDKPIAVCRERGSTHDEEGRNKKQKGSHCTPSKQAYEQKEPF